MHIADGCAMLSSAVSKRRTLLVMSWLGLANKEKAVNDLTITTQVLPTVAANAKFGLHGDPHPFQTFSACYLQIF